MNSVGHNKVYTAGGAAGSILRPIALRKCVDVANKNIEGLDIFASGGIISGDHALSYIHYGAKALQVCSAVQNLDASTVFYDLKTSLQANMYLLADKDLVKKGWKGQYPPYNYQHMSTADFSTPKNEPKVE